MEVDYCSFLSLISLLLFLLRTTLIFRRIILFVLYTVFRTKSIKLSPISWDASLNGWNALRGAQRLHPTFGNGIVWNCEQSLSLLLAGSFATCLVAFGVFRAFEVVGGCSYRRTVRAWINLAHRIQVCIVSVPLVVFARTLKVSI
jgi:hypothetical protein